MYRSMTLLASGLIVLLTFSAAIPSRAIWAEDESPAAEDPFGEDDVDEPPTARVRGAQTAGEARPAPPLRAQIQAITVARPDEKEAAAQIEKKLEETTVFDFVEVPLRDAVVYLVDQHEVAIQFDTNALKKIPHGPATAVTFATRGVSLRSGLQAMLATIGLAYTIKDEALLITTPEVVKNTLVTRIYLVSDLMGQAGPDVGKHNFTPLKDAIYDIVAPDSWDETGGPGVMKEFRNAGALIVSQTRDVHDQIDMLLDGLRQARAEQGIKPVPFPR